MSASWPADKLFPGEWIATAAGIPALVMSHRGDRNLPLVLFLPGGGHLARIAYGHPGADPDDFLLTHLTRAGHGALALSYPTSHPSFDRPMPAITITEWAECIAVITARLVHEETLPRRVVAIGWSLGGRLARALTVALESQGIDTVIFVGLSAPPPMPGFGALTRDDMRFAPSGLLDGSSTTSRIFLSRERQLSVIDQINGRVVIPRDVYARLYVTDSPINFRGEAERFSKTGLVSDLAAAAADQGTFDFAGFPICASIAARGVSDAQRALTSGPAWAMFTAQALWHRLIAPALTAGRDIDDVAWADLCDLMLSLPDRLTRHADGSHLFFVGQIGASATSAYVLELASQADRIRGEIGRLLD